MVGEGHADRLALASPAAASPRPTLTSRTISRGFTLVVIIVVVTLLGILAAVVTPQLSGAAQDAREAALATNLTNLRQQIALYIAEHNGRGPHLDEGDHIQQDELTARMTRRTDPSGAFNDQGTCGPYVRDWPANPFCDPAKARLVRVGSWGAPFRDGRTGWYYSSATCILSANSTKGAEAFDTELPAGRRTK